MHFSKYSRKIFTKRFFSASPPHLEQEIKYTLKEFLQDYEKRTKSSQDALKKSIDTKLELYKNDIKVYVFSRNLNILDRNNLRIYIYKEYT
jgi:hypothetical protein